MKLKSVCQIVLIITVVSMLLTLAGYAISYIPVFKGGFHLTSLAHMAIGILAWGLHIGGLLIFLLAFMQQLKHPSPNATMFIIAGTLILLGTLIGIGTNLSHISDMNRNSITLRSALYMGKYGCSFFAGLFLGAFVFVQDRDVPTAKFLASAALVIEIALFGILIAINVTTFPEIAKGSNALRPIGYITMFLAGYAYLAAMILFLIAYLITPRSELENFDY